MVQVLAISKYDGRGTISLQDSVKSQHILQFFPNFVAWARRLETLLVGTDAEAEGMGVLSACMVSIMVIERMIQDQTSTCAVAHTVVNTVSRANTAAVSGCPEHPAAPSVCIKS